MLYLRLFCAALLFGLMFYIGINRKPYDNYLAKKFGDKIGYHYSQEKFPTDLDKILKSTLSNHKWLGATTFSLAFIVISILIIRILFGAYSMLQIAWFYLYTTLTISLLIALGIITDNYFISYGFAQNIKKVIQSPLLTLFFILYFWKIKPAKESTKLI